MQGLTWSRAGDGSLESRTGQPGAAALVRRELRRNDKVSSPPPSFSFLFFFFLKKNTFGSSMAQSGRRKDGGCLKDVFLLLPFFLFLLLHKRRETQTHSGSEATPERRLRSSTYVELGNYGLAVNSGERRQQLPPPQEKSKRRARTTNIHPFLMDTHTGLVFHTEPLWTYMHPRRPSRAAPTARQPFCRSCFRNVQLEIIVARRRHTETFDFHS